MIVTVIFYIHWGVTPHLFCLSDLVSPLSFVNSPTIIFFLRASPTWRCHSGGPLPLVTPLRREENWPPPSYAGMPLRLLPRRKCSLCCHLHSASKMFCRTCCNNFINSSLILKILSLLEIAINYLQNKYNISRHFSKTSFHSVRRKPRKLVTAAVDGYDSKNHLTTGPPR